MTVSSGWASAAGVAELDGVHVVVADQPLGPQEPDRQLRLRARASAS